MYKNYLEPFKKELVSEKKSSSTIQAYLKDIEQFISFLDQTQSKKEYNEYDVTEFLEQITLEGNLTKKTISRKLNSLRKFDKFLISKRLLRRNIFQIKSPKTISKQRILKKDEITKLRKTCQDNLKVSLILELALQLGLKISEISNLKLKDFDLKKRKVKIVNPSSKREILITDKFYYLLKTYLLENKIKGSYVLQTAGGKYIEIRNLRSSVSRYFKKCNLDNVSLNDLRNTFIVKQLEAGNSVEFVGKVVGHTSSLATKKYLKFVKTKRRKNPVPVVVEI